MSTTSAQLSDKLRRSLSNLSDIGGLWAKISHSTVLGFERPPQRNQWYDEECHESAAAKNAGYKKTLQSAATQAVVENYREKRREERCLFRHKKREQERLEREEVEMYRCRNDARKFYQKFRKFIGSLDQNFNLV